MAWHEDEEGGDTSDPEQWATRGNRRVSSLLSESERALVAGLAWSDDSNDDLPLTSSSYSSMAEIESIDADAVAAIPPTLPLVPMTAAKRAEQAARMQLARRRRRSSLSLASPTARLQQASLLDGARLRVLDEETQSHISAASGG